MDDKILLEIKEQQGIILARTEAIDKNITELKQKDITQSQDLEKAYEKAKARQDSIRDDLQHQIDSNKTLILTVGESINTLNRNIEKIIEEFKVGVNKKLSEFEEKMFKENEKLDIRIKNIETKKEKTLAKWYDKIIDKLIWVFAFGAIVVLLKWLNAPPEIMNQLPH